MLMYAVNIQGTIYVIWHFPKVFDQRTVASHLLSGLVFSRTNLGKGHAGGRELYITAPVLILLISLARRNLHLNIPLDDSSTTG